MGGAPAVGPSSQTLSARRAATGRLMRRERNRQERAALKATRRFFRSASSRVSPERVEGTDPATIAFQLLPDRWFREAFNAQMTRRWWAALWTGWEHEKRWIDTGGEQAARWVAQSDEPPLPSLYVEPSDEVVEAIRDHLASRQRGVWSLVSKTTRKRLEKVVRDSINNDDPLKDRAAKIRKALGPGGSQAQAERIARTEMTGAMNTGQQEERVVDGVDEKEWLATLDNVTRNGAGRGFDHLSADRQIAKTLAFFFVSGEKLLYPGDTSGGASAGNIVNCRCTSLSVI